MWAARAEDVDSAADFSAGAAAVAVLALAVLPQRAALALEARLLVLADVGVRAQLPVLAVRVAPAADLVEAGSVEVLPSRQSFSAATARSTN